MLCPGRHYLQLRARSTRACVYHSHAALRHNPSTSALLANPNPSTNGYPRDWGMQITILSASPYSAYSNPPYVAPLYPTLCTAASPEHGSLKTHPARRLADTAEYGTRMRAPRDASWNEEVRPEFLELRGLQRGGWWARTAGQALSREAREAATRRGRSEGHAGRWNGQQHGPRTRRAPRSGLSPLHSITRSPYHPPHVPRHSYIKTLATARSLARAHRTTISRLGLRRSTSTTIAQPSETVGGHLRHGKGHIVEGAVQAWSPRRTKDTTGCLSLRPEPIDRPNRPPRPRYPSVQHARPKTRIVICRERNAQPARSPSRFIFRRYTQHRSTASNAITWTPTPERSQRVADSTELAHVDVTSNTHRDTGDGAGRMLASCGGVRLQRLELCTMRRGTMVCKGERRLGAAAAFRHGA